MSLHRLVAGLLLAALAALITPAGAETKVLRVVPHADLTLLDPVFAPILITREFGLMIYEELFAWDSQLQPKPQMVENWSTSPDGLTWRFTLRDGLKFHDGQVVTTADVIPSLRRWMGRDLVGTKLLAVLASLEPVDQTTFELKLRKPYPYLLFSLASGSGQLPAIMRAKDLEGDPAKPVTTAIGSGPFRFNHAEHVSGALSVFERNPAYVPRREPADGLSGGRLAKVERVEWRVIPDASTVSTALQNGEIDIWEQPTPDLVTLLSQKQGVRVQRAVNISVQAFLRPNALYPPFNNPKARLALAYIVDQADVMAAGFGDEKFWRACNAYYVCGGPYGTEAGTEDFRPDPTKARALLAEAGYHGEKMVFASTHEVAWIGHMTEVVADELKRVGMDVEIIWSDRGTMARRTASQNPPAAGGWNMFASAAGAAMYDPLTNLGTNMSCDRNNSAGWPCDEHAEELRQAFLDASEGDKPAALDRLHRHLAQVHPYRVLGQFEQPVALRANITGLLTSPVIVYWNVEKH